MKNGNILFVNTLLSPFMITSIFLCEKNNTQNKTIPPCTMADEKDRSAHWGFYAHLHSSFLAVKGLIMRKYRSFLTNEQLRM